MTNNQVRAFGAMVDGLIQAMNLLARPEDFKREQEASRKNPFDAIRKDLFGIVDELAPRRRLMGNYRPITDFWLLGRAKRANGIKRYGGYLAGFPERARKLLGVTLHDPVLHACGGLARHYPYHGGFGPNDMTLDCDPEVQPDFLQDARDPWPVPLDCLVDPEWKGRWSAILIDPPYSPEDAERYPAGREGYPTPHQLLTRAVEVLRPGGRVGIIHYLWPNPVKGLVPKEVAAVCVTTGRNARARHFVVFEKER